ncbi:MAG: RNA polymerase sigma factor [Acidobacteriota bacterium]
MTDPRSMATGQTATHDSPADPWTIFAEAIERYRAPLIRVAYRTTRNLEEAEDIVQEALMKAYVCRHQFRGESRVETWLRAIVVNTARNWIRRRRGYVLLQMEQCQPGESEGVPHEIADSRRNPEQWFEYQELESKLMKAVNGLGSRYQAVIRMCVLGESSYLEASSALNLNLVTVKARVFRGREMLRRSLHRTLPARRKPIP